MIKKRGCRFRVILDSKTQDCKYLEEAMFFILENWKEKTSYANIKIVCKRNVASNGFKGDKE